MNTIWTILGILTPILLVAHWQKRGAVWGGFTVGITIGLIIALFSGFDWYVVGKGAISGTILGFVAELLGKISDRIKTRK